MEATETTKTVSLYRFTFEHRIPMQVWAASVNEAHSLIAEDAARFTVTGFGIAETD